jgi:hypothetical protein
MECRFYNGFVEGFYQCLNDTWHAWTGKNNGCFSWNTGPSVVTNVYRVGEQGREREGSVRTGAPTWTGSGTKGHFTHETESPWPLHFKHSHWWKTRSRSKFTSRYAWGTNGVRECKMDVKSTWIPTWHRTDHVSRSLGLFPKPTSWR